MINALKNEHFLKFNCWTCILLIQLFSQERNISIELSLLKRFASVARGKTFSSNITNIMLNTKQIFREMTMYIVFLL